MSNSLAPVMSDAADHAAAVQTRAATVVRLSVSDFRCYSRLRLDVDAAPVVLTGPNGAGKTNLLEALSFLAPGRGLRRAKLGELDRRQRTRDGALGDPAGGAWAIHASLE